MRADAASDSGASASCGSSAIVWHGASGKDCQLRSRACRRSEMAQRPGWRAPVTGTAMSASGCMSRLGWHVALCASAACAVAAAKTRLVSSWDDRARDTQAGESIVRHFECCWEEGLAMRRVLLQDLHRKLDALFPVDSLVASLDGLSTADGRQDEKVAVWQELKIEGPPARLPCSGP